MQVPGYLHAIRVLEFDSVLKRLTDYTYSEPGRQKLAELAYFEDADDLSAELQRVTEMRDLFDFDDPFPLQSFSDIRSRLKKAAVAGAFLSALI
jgi:dsDNA-specific endonuclease/ATPase MutS2